MPSQPPRALLAQLLGLAAVMGLAWALPDWQPGAWRLAMAQAVAAALFARLLGQPAWWLPLHLLFAPALLAAAALQLPAGFYLAGFVFLLLLYWGTVRGDAPLYLSSAGVAEAVAQIVRREQARHFAELGAGIGTVVVPLARQSPELGIEAWERAPLPWALLRWRCRKLDNVDVTRSSFWEGDLSIHDVVFAFLSPLPMARLGEKIGREMRPGSLFVSAEFPVPGWTPESVLRAGDRRGTLLYCYRQAAGRTPCVGG